MNKKYLMFGLMAMFAMVLVAATYAVSSFVITTDVYEPFEVEHAIIGDAGNWDGVTTCEDYTGEWQVGTDVDVGGLYAGEGRMVCARITNLGEGEIAYTFSGEVISGQGNMAECEAAFGTPSVTGTVEGLDTVEDGLAVIVAGDAVPVEDCQITLSVSRG